jgi:hypothetical protein
MRTLTILLLMLLSATSVLAQVSPTRVSSDSSTTNPTYALEQQGTLSVTQNPVSSAQLFACFEDGVLASDASAKITCAKSTDSGATWTKVLLKRLDTYIVGKYVSVSRPSVAWSSTGDIFLVVTAAKSSGVQNVLFMKSTNSGLTFSKPKSVFTSTALDVYHPSLVVNNVNADADIGTLYLAYTKANSADSTSALYVVRSVNNGGLWLTPKKISSDISTSLSNIGNENPVASIGGDGELEVVWTRIDKTSALANKPVLVSSRSSSAVSEWSAPTKIVENKTVDSSSLVTQAAAPSTYFASTSNTQFVAYQKNVSSVYFSAIEVMKRARSSNSWSTAVRIAKPSQAYACFNPSLSGDGNAAIVVAFQCLINNKTKIQSYQAKSSDAGVTFSRPTAIFSTSFTLSNAASVAVGSLTSSFIGGRTALVRLSSGYGFLSGGAYFFSRKKTRAKQVDIVFAGVS